MSIDGYSHVFAIGFSCMPTHQLTRAAQNYGLSESRISGPFDWMGVTLPQLVKVVEQDFQDYFRPEKISMEGVKHESTWRIVDSSGTRSWHHLRRAADDTSPTVAAWRGFRRWINQRVGHWLHAMQDPNANVLLLRAEDAFDVDRSDQMEALADAIALRARATFRLASICFDRTLETSNPAIVTFSIARTWPAGLVDADINWEQDYGLGVAWKGHDATWDRIFERI